MYFESVLAGQPRDYVAVAICLCLVDELMESIRKLFLVGMDDVVCSILQGHRARVGGITERSECHAVAIKV